MVTDHEFETAAKVAYKIGSRWRAVDVEDLTQELYLWCLENQAYLDRWRTEPGGGGKLYVSLRRFAATWCEKQTKHSVGADLNAGNIYNEASVEAALPFIWEVTDEEKGRMGEDARTILADISGGFHGLPKPQRELLTLRYKSGLTFPQIAEITGGTAEGARKAVNRSLERLVKALGGQHPRWDMPDPQGAGQPDTEPDKDGEW